MSATAKQITEAARTIKQQIHSQHRSTPGLCSMTINRWQIEGWTMHDRVRFDLPEPIEELTDEATNTDPESVLKAMKEYKPGDSVRMSAENGQISTAGITLPAPDAKDWADLPPEADSTPTTYPASEVLAVAQFASKDDMRPVLTGIRFEPTAIVATDSYRLAVNELHGLPGDGVTIARRWIEAVCKMAGSGQPVGVAYNTHEPADKNGQRRVPRFTISTNTKAGSHITVSADPIEGQYPAYGQLFPEQWDSSGKLQIEAARKQVAKVSRWAEGNRPVVISHQEGAYALEYASPNGGAKVAPVEITGNLSYLPPVVNEDGEETPRQPVDKTGVNPEFLADALEYVTEREGAEPILSMISPLRPMKLEDRTRRALLMPVRIGA